MRFIDIHTHNEKARAGASILNTPDYISGRKISIGIHPWEIGCGWQARLQAIEEEATCSNVAAIGECGIDHVRAAASTRLQDEVFRAHAMLAERVQKPLIIHCVKGIDEIIAARKDIAPAQPWIMHGFRGKPQQAMQLARAGMYISLGEHFNASTAKAIPASRLFIESDESAMPIEEIYRRIAQARETSIEELALQIAANAAIFGQFRAL